jgi:hypothetical protein
MSAATRAASGEIGGYVDHTGMRHQVHVRRVEAQAWEIADVPERGEPTVIERLSGELESDKTALAVARDYLTQVAARWPDAACRDTRARRTSGLPIRNRGWAARPAHPALREKGGVSWPPG